MKSQTVNKIVATAMAVTVLGASAMPGVLPSNADYVSAATKSSVKVSLSKKSVSLKDGQSYTLKLKGAKGTVKWKSGNAAKVAVSSKGKLVAKRPGRTIVRATYKGKTYKCNVSVKTPKLNVTSKTVLIGNKLNLSLSNNVKKIKWSSSNNKVATVSSKGVVTAKAAGTVTITAKTSSASYRCRVSTPAPQINKKSAEITVGDPLRLKLSNVGSGAVIWSTSNKDVAQVDGRGNVITKGAGEVVISAKYGGATYKCNLTVNAPLVEATGVEISEINASDVRVGHSIQLEATITPEDVTDNNVTWSSSDTSVATVTGSGVVTFKKVGTVVITCVTADGKASTNIELTVPETGNDVLATDITITGIPTSVKEGDTFSMVGRVIPATASQPTVTWVSNNPTVMSVTANGMATAIKEGRAELLCKSADGAITKTLVFDVKAKSSTIIATGLTLNKSGDDYSVGKTLRLQPVFTPENTTNKSVTYTSDNTYVAAVDEEGLVTFLRPGTATITCKSAPNGVESQMSFTVVKAGGSSTDPERTEYSMELTNIPEELELNRTARVSGVLKGNGVALDDIVKFRSSDTSTLEVKDDGTIKALKAGSAMVTAYVDGKSITQTFTVRTVNVKVKQISIDGVDEANCRIGGYLNLRAVVSPDDAFNKGVTWESSDSTIARVDEDGYVYFSRAGKVVITCTSKENTGVRCDVELNIIDTSTGAFSLSGLPEASTLKAGKTFKLTPVGADGQALSGNFRWESDKDSVVVDSAGNVTINSYETEVDGEVVTDGEELRDLNTVTITCVAEDDLAHTYEVTFTVVQ